MEECADFLSLRDFLKPWITVSTVLKRWPWGKQTRGFISEASVPQGLECVIRTFIIMPVLCFLMQFLPMARDSDREQ